MGFQYRRIGAAPTDAHDGGVFDKFDYYQLEKQGQIYNSPQPIPNPPSGHVATGGIISDYQTPGGDYYRAHVFLNPGTFSISELSSVTPANVEYMVIGGGGGGGGGSNSSDIGGGGGGAGGFKTNLSGHPAAGSAFPVSAVAYQVTVGNGGFGNQMDGPVGWPSMVDGTGGSPGGDSYFGPPSAPDGITAEGGGLGGTRNQNSNIGYPGGSGGGASHSGVGGEGEGGTIGNDGGPSTNAAGGGGGAGGAGSQGGPGNPGGNGGVGIQCFIAGNPTFNGLGMPGPSGTGWFCGGGGGGNANYEPTNVLGGEGGGPGGPYAGGADGGGATPPGAGWAGQKGVDGTGGGGGGGGRRYDGTSGGSGVVVVRYQLQATDTDTAKATGGSISFANGKTIHTFLNPGTFATSPTWASPTTVTYLIVGGGGGGGKVTPNNNPWDTGAGGGGGGAVRYGTTPLNGPESFAITVGNGGAGAINNFPANNSPSPTTPWQTPNTNVTMNGGTSSVAFPSPAGGTMHCGGGGGGSNRHSSPYAGTPGVGPTAAVQGSGGGGSYNATGTGGTSGGENGHPGGIDVASPAPGEAWAHAGGGNPGASPGAYAGAGGGGAAGEGGDGNASSYPLGRGGLGARYTIEAGITGAVSDAIYYGGGGGGGYGVDANPTFPSANPAPAGESGGRGGNNDPATNGANGKDGRGGGGGGGSAKGTSSSSGPDPWGGNGGSGIVVIAYPT